MAEDGVEVAELAGLGLGNGPSEAQTVATEDKPVKELTDDELKERIFKQLTEDILGKYGREYEGIVKTGTTLPDGTHFDAGMVSDESRAARGSEPRASMAIIRRDEKTEPRIAGRYEVSKNLDGRHVLERSFSDTKAVSRGVAEGISEFLASVPDAIANKRTI